ncbi:hypothetical protein H8356DRAFT_923550 [Neocallimastix lanati (nom. inval.)]|jgi:hypothetical protein|uniref:Uncharacterized protein n=1 Tax=Neocallimastix californiae TaxID=1754190 RepID=A0A1Y2ESB5_9FUNG|nr:hypothetical protein H8356DRAFT_923550 [Neocallimastix sp. JGI-2020a]ORY74407.1 hypothetical protein LY90DRAFT_666210 [Neocallimastix californiae]|eukprot:ORY74407.1 hypothetical protein LY90DRAFT_666210 [Neocallimastix californiae]
MIFRKTPNNIKYIDIITDIFLSICKEMNIEPSEAISTPIMAAYPELNSYYQDIWNKLFTSFSNELLYLQSQYPNFDLKNMIYYISLNGLSTMDEKSVGYSIKKAKHLKRKIIEIKVSRFLSHFFIYHRCMTNQHQLYNII